MVRNISTRKVFPQYWVDCAQLIGMERNICLGVGYNWSFGLRLSTCFARGKHDMGERKWRTLGKAHGNPMVYHVQSCSIICHENRHKLEYPRFLDHPKLMFYRYQNHSPNVSRSNCSWTHRHGEIVAMGWQTKGTGHDPVGWWSNYGDFIIFHRGFNMFQVSNSAEVDMTDKWWLMMVDDEFGWSCSTYWKSFIVSHMFEMILQSMYFGNLARLPGFGIRFRLRQVYYINAAIAPCPLLPQDLEVASLLRDVRLSYRKQYLHDFLWHSMTLIQNVWWNYLAWLI